MLKWLMILLFTALLFSCKQQTLFRKLDAGRTGIDFNNLINDTGELSILELEYIYNGGGVAIADFNNDSLDDIFFTGNMVPNKMYINQGGFKFKEAKDAGIAGQNKWCTGVASIDINTDGLMDLYVCASIKKTGAERANMLFINQGNDKSGMPSFKEEAAAYGLADTGHSTTAAFFDYDNDGDLDVYVLTNMMVDARYPNHYRRKITDGSSPNNDRLYRNDFNSLLKHAVFTDVTKAAGITIEGFGLGLNITDINKDGWKDIYVTNDYLSNDLLWINNRNGTFTNKAGEYFKHTSYSAMGNDVADINNDGLMDVMAVDMLPETNYRKKMMMSANSYQTNLNNDEYNYEYQYGRNTLQLNQGNAINAGDSVSHPVFSEIAFLAGVAETDWSWTPLLADFDNDGFRDLLVTNGFPKDITDHDFMTFRAEATSIASREDILQQIPAVKLPKYAFRNNGDLTFSNVSKQWGLNHPGFSNGAAYADLDNDGDLDLVINNINDEALIYENTSMHRDTAFNYLQVALKGPAANPLGLGTWIELYYNGSMQAYEHTIYRGYLSSLPPYIHFGLGKVKQLDSMLVKWPGGKMQRLLNVKTNQRLHVDVREAAATYTFNDPLLATQPLFSDVTSALSIKYTQQEIDFADFNVQKLLPHKLSEYGPSIACGDVDGNGLEDLVIGGSYGFSSTILLQQKTGQYLERQMLPGSTSASKQSEDMGVALFDMDGDNDLDLYISSGSYEHPPGSEAYADNLYMNDGSGNFICQPNALPLNRTSKSCVRPFDYDHDGDLDLFIGGRVSPWNYPQPVSSFIYRNDSNKGVIQFTDVTATVAGELQHLGLVCDAVASDIDNDGWEDLVITGEWMPLTFFKNDKGRFRNITSTSGIVDQAGLWSSILPGDFDNDGDMDYIVGNLGLNSFYRASQNYPARIYAKDFDNNGSYDAIPSLYLADEDGNKHEYPAQTRDDLVKQMIGMRARFQNYRSYATATFDKILTPEELKDALIVKANNFRSCIVLNNGNGTFTMKELPTLAQVSMINGMVSGDFNEDGKLDLVLNGNDYGTEVSVGRYDALNGLFLKGDGKGNFAAASIRNSGIYIPGNGKALVKSLSANGSLLLFAGQNRGPLKAFRLNRHITAVPVFAGEYAAFIHLKNGKTRKEELNYGASFLSQSSRLIETNSTMTSIEIKDHRGNTRTIVLQK